jgi:hypothetical protein
VKQLWPLALQSQQSSIVIVGGTGMQWCCGSQ